jgi:putative FmdB family regulatory protein
MPIYEYVCTKCGDELEQLQRFSEKPISKCKKCGGKLHKLISTSSFHLKGTGWYVTDYSRSTNAAARTAKADSKANLKADSKNESKTESKADSKTDSKSDSQSNSTSATGSKPKNPASSSEK